MDLPAQVPRTALKLGISVAPRNSGVFATAMAQTAKTSFVLVFHIPLSLHVVFKNLTQTTP